MKDKRREELIKYCRLKQSRRMEETNIKARTNPRMEVHSQKIQKKNKIEAKLQRMTIIAEVRR
jgi:hypothetical protein